MATSKKVEARKRARAAKARVDARRAKRDEDISKSQTAFFVAAAEREEALQAMASAEDHMATAVSELSDLDVRVEDIADLCEIPASEVRSLKKREKSVAEEPSPTTSLEGVAVG